MPPTDSMEKPRTAECTAGPIAVFSNSYARLPERFFARLDPTPVPKPRLIKFNELLASELGVNAQGREPDELAAVFAGNVSPPGAEPIAMAYAGHQFGSFMVQRLMRAFEPGRARRGLQSARRSCARREA